MPPKQQQRGGAVAVGSSGGVPPPKQRRAKETVAAVGSSSGGMSQRRRPKEAAVGEGALIEEEMQQLHLRGKENVGTASIGGRALHKEEVHNGLSGEMLQKQRESKVALRGKMLAKENMHKGPTGESARKHHVKQETGQALLLRHPPGTRVQGAVDIGTQLIATREKQTKSNRSLPRNSSLRATGQKLRSASSQRLSTKTDGNSTAQDCTKSGSNGNAVVHVTEGKDLQEAKDAIKRLNELGLGEEISSDEFLELYKQLPADPVIDTYTKMDLDQMIPHYNRHAHYRIRYYKLSQKASKDKLRSESEENYLLKSLQKDDFSEEFLDKMRYFKELEEDGTLDWSFDPDLCRLEALNDYQRLVPQNYAGCEYLDWDQYRKFLHSYETELEYLDYCKELSEKLKWMEDYVLVDLPSVKWGMISTRGVHQAIKIATGFSKITHTLAYHGYFDCVQNLNFYAFWLKDLDGVYFEIWLRVAKQKRSFIEALEEVYKLQKFPLREVRMKNALENDYSKMKAEFDTCTASVTSEVTEEKAHELIAEAVKKLKRRPRLYEDYILKKIAIAQDIGLIPMNRVQTI